MRPNPANLKTEVRYVWCVEVKEQSVVAIRMAEALMKLKIGLMQEANGEGCNVMHNSQRLSSEPVGASPGNQQREHLPITHKQTAGYS